MKTFVLEMRTPDGVFLEEKATEYVVLPSSEGRYGVLALHAPTILWLQSGICEYTVNGEKKRIFVMEGVADVTRDKVTVLSDFIETESKALESLKKRAEYFAEEKKRRKDSYYEYKQSSIELTKAMRNLTSKKTSPNL